MLISSESTERL